MSARSISILLLSALLNVAHAADFGQVRIVVKQANPQHNTPVTLKLNNLKFASFSHSASTQIRVDVGKQHLAVGKNTPLNSDYASLQVGCEFEFSIEYSLEDGSWIPLGSYRAPSTAVSTSLPIGLCGEELCSNDPTVQAKLTQLEDARWKRSAQAVKDWFDDIFKREEEAMRAEKEKLRQQEVKSPDDKEYRDTASDLEAFFKDAVAAESLQPSLEQLRDQDFLESVVDETQLEALLAKQEREEDFLNWCSGQGLNVQYLCSKYGGLGWLGAVAEVAASVMEAETGGNVGSLTSRILGSDAISDVKSALEQRTEARLAVQKVLDAKRAKAKWNDALDVFRLGVSITPLGDALDLCELTTGREYCLAAGKILSPAARFAAALALIAGSRLVWEALSDNIKLGAFEDFAPKGDPHALSTLLKDLNKVSSSTSEEINSLLRQFGYTEPPYRPGTKVFEFVSTQEVADTFIRVLGPNRSEQGRFFVRKIEVEGLSPIQMKDKLFLQELPTHYSEVTIPAGVPIRKGFINTQLTDWGDRHKPGYLQYEFVFEKWPSHVPKEPAFSPKRPLK